MNVLDVLRRKFLGFDGRLDVVVKCRKSGCIAGRNQDEYRILA